MSTDLTPAPHCRSRRRWYIIAGVLGLVALLLVDDLIRREVRRRWLKSEIIAVGGQIYDYREVTWHLKLAAWFRTGEYPRTNALVFSRTIGSEWLREHDYLQGFEATDLDVINQAVSGDDLACLIEAQPLRTIRIAVDDLTERTIAAIAEKQGIKELQCIGDGFTDDVLVRFDIREVKHLALQQTAVTSEGFKILSSCRQLQEIELSGRQFSEQVANDLAAIGTVNSVFLSGSDVTDEHVDRLLQIKSITDVLLVDTRISQEAQDRLKKEGATRSMAISIR
jgi:hypothetical protein